MLYNKITKSLEVNMDISAISKKNSPKSRMIYHEDPQALHIGTLPKHCYFIPFAPGEDSSVAYTHLTLPTTMFV